MTSEAPHGHSAPYRALAADSRGRFHDEAVSRTRSCYQRDRDRVIHSGAFRKLQYKTQVFVYHEGDYFRTRLTHSLEVAQIARSVCRQLGLDEDLAETLALAHDLGHTPFGHAGETALCDVMGDFGGFDHNEQTFRVVTALERRYPAFDGLNLTWESLEGLIKHNGPLAPKDLPPSMAALHGQWDLDPGSQPSLEAQVAALADDIAYNNHDIDDGLRAGLFEIADLEGLAPLSTIFAAVARDHPGLERARSIHEAVRRLIGFMIDDLVAETRRRLAESGIGSIAEVRTAGRPIAAFSEEMRAQTEALRAFLFQRMYRHHRVTREMDKAKEVVRGLFRKYFAQPDCLPDDWRRVGESLQGSERARLVADYIAGMTDRYALKEHQKLFEIRTLN